MPAVTRDATAGKWFAASAAEMTSLVGGRSALTGLAAALVEIWNMQDAAGNLVGATGTQTLTGSGSSYQNAVAGYSRKAVQPPSGSGGGWSNTAGPLGDTGNTSQFLLVHAKVSTTSGTDRDLIGMQFSTGYRGIQINTADKVKYAPNDGSAIATGAANPIGTGLWYMLQTDRTNNFEGVRTDQESIQQAPNTNPSAISNGIIIGPALSNGAFSYMFWGAGFRGAGSELTATGWAQLLDCLNNGPAVTGIAVTPNAPTLAGVGSTQQLTATCTRNDGTTYDGTSPASIAAAGLAIGNVTWSSSAPSVATVSATGLVTAVGAGNAVITATFTSLGAAAASGTSNVTVSGAVTADSGIAPPESVLTLIRFDEANANVPPSDELASLTDLAPLATTPAVVGAFCGFGRQLGNGLGFTASDVKPGYTLATRDVTIQAIASWDLTAQNALGTDGVLAVRGKGNTTQEGVSYGLLLHVVDPTQQIGEMRMFWQDTSGAMHVEQGGQFILPAAGSFMLITACRHWIDATHVELRYYVGHQLVGEQFTTDGDIGGGTTGTFAVGAQFSGGVWTNYFCGVIDELRVLNYEITAEEIGATWARLSKWQPRGYAAVKQMMQPGAPISNDPSSRIQKLLRIVGHGLGYAAAQAENFRHNSLPDRAYGPVLAEWETITGEAPLASDTVQKRRKRVLSHLRQKAGVSLPGVAATTADLLAIGKSQVQVIGFNNTISDDFSQGIRPTLWAAVPQAQFTIVGNALRLQAASGATLNIADGTWYTCFAAALGSRAKANGSPAPSANTNLYYDGRECHFLTKMVPTSIPSNGEIGVAFFDWVSGNALLFGMRSDGTLQRTLIVGGVQQSSTAIALGAVTTTWFHVWQNNHAGAPAGQAFYNVAYSTDGPTSGYITSADFAHPKSFQYMGLYARSWNGAVLTGAIDVAFDDVIMRSPYSSRTMRFYVYRDPTLPGTPDLAGAELAVKRLQQSQSDGHVITAKVALCDTPGAGCDRSPMGGF